MIQFHSELWQQATFEAAHRLDARLGEPCLHGHSYWVRAWWRSPVAEPLAQPEAKRLLDAVVARLDHGLLNDHMAEPTMEAIAHWIYEHIEAPKPVQIEVWRESVGCGAVLRISETP